MPPGRSERSAEIVLPISGRFLAVGGHLHDQGESVRLEDVQTGRVLVRVIAHRSPDGTVHGVSRRLLALSGRGLHLKAGRRYRVVAVYNNVRADTARHAMGELVGIFAPDDMRQWPKVDANDPVYLADLANYGVGRRGEQTAQHEHHMHSDAAIFRRSPEWRNGRRNGLKIRRGQPHESSTLSSGIRQMPTTSLSRARASGMSRARGR